MVWFSRQCHSFVARIKGKKLPEGGADLKVEWFFSGARAFPRHEVHPKPCLSSLSSFLVLHPTPPSLFGADLTQMPPRVLLQKLLFSPDVSEFWKKRLRWVTSWLLVCYSAISLLFVLLDWCREEERQSNGGRGLDRLSLQAQGGSASWCVGMGGALAQRSQEQI